MELNYQSSIYNVEVTAVFKRIIVVKINMELEKRKCDNYVIPPYHLEMTFALFR